MIKGRVQAVIKLFRTPSGRTSRVVVVVAAAAAPFHANTYGRAP